MQENNDKINKIESDNTTQNGDINLGNKEQNAEETKAELKTKLAKQIKKQVLEVFDGNPDLKSVFVTSDGQIFPDTNKSDAINHSKRNGAVKREKALEMIEVLRSEI